MTSHGSRHHGGGCSNQSAQPLAPTMRSMVRGTNRVFSVWRLRLFSCGGYGLALAALALVVFGAIECPPFWTSQDNFEINLIFGLLIARVWFETYECWIIPVVIRYSGLFCETALYCICQTRYGTLDRNTWPSEFSDHTSNNFVFRWQAVQRGRSYVDLEIFF